MKKTILIFLFILCGTTVRAQLQWVQKHFIQFEAISTLQCLDSNNCYAFLEGKYGSTVIYRSTDQGNTWNNIYEYDSLQDSIWGINHCYVLDTNNIYMIYGSRAILEKSSDGGKTFSRKTFGAISERPWEQILDIRMYNERIGLISSVNYLIITFDKWENYKIVKIPEGELYGSNLFFIDSTNVVMMKTYTRNDEFVQFDMVEETWEDYNEGEELEPGENIKSIVDICFVNDTLGFACGGQQIEDFDTRINIIWKTTDRGKHWRIVNENKHTETSFGLTRIAFREDGKRGMAVASWGIMLETNDYGETWEYIEPPEINKNATLTRIAFAGQYPIVTSTRGGIQRQELVDDVSVETVEDGIKIIQTSKSLELSIQDQKPRKLQIQIVDILGRTVLDESFINRRNISIDLSNINSGFYVYQILSDGRLVKTGKIIM
jgi:photosystem II stability/assembly factor-like uncharacterized protein